MYFVGQTEKSVIKRTGNSNGTPNAVYQVGQKEEY